MGSCKHFKQNSFSFSKRDLALLSNISKYLEQICDAQNDLYNKKALFNFYVENKDLAISNNQSDITIVKNCIDSNLLILNELAQLTNIINTDIQKLWKNFKNNEDENTLKTTYSLLKTTFNNYLNYVKDNKRVQLKNNKKIYAFLRKAQKQYEHYIYISLNKKTYQRKTLLITEKKIFLPYRDEEIQKLIKQNSNANVEDIINKKYVINNVRYYKSSSKKRFTLGYRLSRNSNNSSTLEAIKFGLKVSKVRNLHPAIIRACHSQDQLENYIMYLNQGNPSAFTDFDVKFQINPI